MYARPYDAKFAFLGRVFGGRCDGCCLIQPDACYVRVFASLRGEEDKGCPSRVYVHTGFLIEVVPTHHQIRAHPEYYRISHFPLDKALG